jgi:hypothetical protein
VPDNVRALIGCWLERLDAQEKRVLAAAAVIGRERGRDHGVGHFADMTVHHMTAEHTRA